MLGFIARLFRTVLSGRGVLLIVSMCVSWLIVSISRNQLNNFFSSVINSDNYPYMVIMFLPIIGFIADACFELFYSKTSDLTNVAVLLLCVLVVFISFFGVTLLSIPNVGSYLFSMVLFIAPTTVILYKTLMVLMELFYKLRLFIVGNEM
jgi:hypothetical protein